VSGTRAGNLKTRDTIIRKYGKDFWAQTGSKGGKAQVPKGFALSGKQYEAGHKGGSISRKRGPNKRVSQWTRSINIR
jgi:hypothetical protein